jgi:hypothetical protein
MDIGNLRRPSLSNVCGACSSLLLKYMLCLPDQEGVSESVKKYIKYQGYWLISPSTSPGSWTVTLLFSNPASAISATDAHIISRHNYKTHALSIGVNIDFFIVYESAIFRDKILGLQI